MYGRLSRPAIRLQWALKHQFERHPWIITVIFSAISFGLFAAYSIERYFAFQTNFFDLGLVSNSIWKTLNGYSSWPSLVLPSSPGHINHISPILGLVAAAYWVAPSPETLLIIQSGVLALAAIPLYLIALRETGNQSASFVVSALYLVNAGLHGIVRYDFHAEAFIPLFVFLVYYTYGRSSGWPFYLSTTLLLTTIEYSAILGVGTGVSLWLAKKRFDKRIIAILASSFTLLGIILVSTIGNGFEQLNWPTNWLSVQFSGNAASQSSGFSQLLGGFLANPATILNVFQAFALDKILYLVVVLAPFWFAPIKYASRMVPAFPWLAIVLTTSKYSFASYDFQYTAFVVPFVFVAAIPFLDRMIRNRKLTLALITVSLCILLTCSALSPFGPHHLWPQPSPIGATIASLNNQIPLNATVLTQADLFPQLSNRPYVSINYSSPEPPQYILVNTNSEFYNWTNPSLGYPVSANQQLENYTSQYSYQLVFLQGGVRLYQLDQPV